MASNLVRGIMGVAARTIMFVAVAILWRRWVPVRRPRRKKPRTAELRAQYHVPQVFPPRRGTRAQARQQLQKQGPKSSWHWVGIPRYRRLEICATLSGLTRL